ncbi:MAG: inorganic phosphate transporter [Chloroflexota bacterium]
MTVGVVLAVVVALAFALTNGFHDAANAIATLVATRVARPVQAVILAAVFNLIGPFVIGSAVANTVGKIIELPPDQTVAVIGAGLTGAVIWNLVTWSRGIPSSSGHALVGGLVGAGLLTAGVDAIEWGPVSDGHIAGVFGILIVLAVAPILAAVAAFLVEKVALRLLRRATVRAGRSIGKAQWFTSAGLAFSHGSNDAQKSVGIIAAVLVAAGLIPTLGDVPPWVILASSAMLTLGTAFGGWNIVKTIGRRIYPIREIDGLVSQGTSASLILTASIIGAPVSTTQVVSSSIVGIGVGRGRYRHVGWEVVRDILVAWVTTIPAAAVIAALSLPFWRFIAA